MKQFPVHLPLTPCFYLFQYLIISFLKPHFSLPPTPFIFIFYPSFPPSHPLPIIHPSICPFPSPSFIHSSHLFLTSFHSHSTFISLSSPTLSPLLPTTSSLPLLQLLMWCLTQCPPVTSCARLLQGFPEELH